MIETAMDACSTGRVETDRSTARTRLLDAAERLFREHGYDQVSVRAINAAAGMNPAAVHYHFGSKEQLVTALLERRLRPAWERHLADLDERRSAGRPLTVAEIASMVTAPMARIAGQPDGRALLRLLARVTLSRRDLPWRSPWSAPEPWIGLLGQARPDLPARVIEERWRLARDLLLLTYGEPLAEPHAADPDPLPGADMVAAFLAAGLDGPPPPGGTTHD
jgi:AcrR family transcriptional regulator